MSGPGESHPGAATDDAGRARADRQSFERVRIEGLEVIHGRSEDPRGTVIFVHGAMDRANSFRRVMRRLGDFDTIAYDRRGYAGSLPGSTTNPAPGVAGEDALDLHARDLATIAEWATSDRSGAQPALPGAPVTVVGHSLGGLIALVGAHPPAGGHPALLAPDSLCAFEAPLPWLEGDRATSGSRAIDVADSHGPEVAAETFYRSMVGDATWARISEDQRTLRRSEGSALVAELRAARLPRDRIPLPPDTVRTHVGRGESGPEHLRKAAEKLAEAAGVECEVIEGASHGAHLASPGRFADWVHRSLAGNH